MDGLLMISYFNSLRARACRCRSGDHARGGKTRAPRDDDRLDGHSGPAAGRPFTAIGSQTQRPLAIVVVGGMFTTLFLTRYLMPVLYSFYGHREPPMKTAVGGPLTRAIEEE